MLSRLSHSNSVLVAMYMYLASLDIVPSLLLGSLGSFVVRIAICSAFLSGVHLRVLSVTQSFTLRYNL